MDVALITCAALPGLHHDDRYLLHALRKAGLVAEPIVWEDRYQDWRAPTLCVIRSAWDYAFRRDHFVAWAERVAATTQLWNPAELVEWNTHKRYLCDLADRGVPVVPTRVLSGGSEANLNRLLEATGWEDVVIKAAVAQSGRYAIRAHARDPRPGQAHLDRLLPHEDMLLQPYLAAVAERGELSVVWIDGEFTHAVRKIPAPGDFRVHDDHGGSVAEEAPDEEELAVAQRAVMAIGKPTLYARVDLVRGSADGPMVMELEVVEPELFLRHAPHAVDRLVAGIRRRLEV